MTTKDLVKFILANRGGTNAYLDWSIPEIISHLLWCVENGTLCYCAVDGRVTGVMTGIYRMDSYYVTNILSIERNMPHFISYILRTFPTAKTISTNRHGRFHKSYPLDNRTIERFMKGTK